MKDFNINNDVVVRYTGSADFVEIPEGIREIGPGAFLNSTLCGISFPKSLKKISFHAFYNCKSLKSADLSGVEELGDKAFFGCSALESLDGCGSLKIIGSNPVMGCSRLAGDAGGCIVFGDTLVSYIGKEKQFRIPDGIRKIAGYAFCYCEELQELTVPEGVEDIADFAFANCTKLRTVEFLCRKLEMGPCIFFNCPRLSRINTHSGLVCPGPLDRQTMCDKKFMRTLALSCLNRRAEFADTQIEYFENFLREEKEFVMDYAIEAGDVFALLFYLDHDLLTEEELRKYLELASALGRAECVARLLKKTAPKEQKEQKLTDILGEW